MKDPRHPTEISFSLQLLNAAVPLPTANHLARILYDEHWDNLRSHHDQTLITYLWHHLTPPTL